MANQIGQGHVYGLASIVLNFGAFIVASGYIMPNMQSLGITQNATVDRIKNNSGVTSSIIGSDENIECSFDFVPEGASQALAATSATLPVVPAAIRITGAPQITWGAFNDVINSDIGTPPWIYEGGGRLSGFNDKHWMLTFILHRYLGITTTSLVT